MNADIFQLFNIGFDGFFYNNNGLSKTRIL
jgi:hypothetical protein